MSHSELLGLVASYAYAAILILIAQALRRLLGVPQELTRKFVHIGAGMWIFGILALFDRWHIGVLPFASFIVVNALFYRHRVFSAMDSPDSSPGTVYFAIAITLLFGLLWRPAGPADRSPIAAAGAMALTWGDAAAALVGRRLGRHRYRIGEDERSLEGSVALFIASTAAIFATLTLLPGSVLSPYASPVRTTHALGAALLASAAATLAEAVSPRGTDNMSIPFIAAGVTWLILG